ncbi:late blight resistance homolog R1B-14 isoform X4, partial [Olea europaea subsp. europaea]
GLISRIFSRLLEFLDRDDYPQLQLAAANAIVDILCYSDDDISINTNILIEQGAAPIMVSLLSSPNDELREKALVVLGEIAGRSADSRDLILRYGVLTLILAQFNDKTNLIIIREATQTLSELCSGPLQLEQVKSAILPLSQLIQEHDETVVRFLVHEGCIKPMCDLLVNPYEAHVIKICLKGLQNILKVGEAEKNQGNTKDVNVFAQMIEVAGGLQKITNLKTYDNRKIRRIAVKILVTYWHQKEDNDEDFDDDDDSVMMSTEDEDEDEDDDDDDSGDDDDDEEEDEDEDEDDSNSKSNTLYSDSKPNTLS